MVFIGIKKVKTQKDFKTSLRQAQESFFALVSPLQFATSLFSQKSKTRLSRIVAFVTT